MYEATTSECPQRVNLRPQQAVVARPLVTGEQSFCSTWRERRDGPSADIHRHGRAALHTDEAYTEADVRRSGIECTPEAADHVGSGGACRSREPHFAQVTPSAKRRTLKHPPADGETPL